MFKIITIPFLLLLFNLTYSQSPKQLLIEKEKLENRKKALTNEISKIDKNLKSLNSQIKLQQIKERSIKTVVSKSCDFLKSASTYSKSLSKANYNDSIYIIEYYPYGTYFKAIYKGNIGYINQRYIRITKEIKKLKKTQKSNKKSNYNSFPRNSSARSSPSRTYSRGPRGGCYYINSNGIKTYVSRSLCN